MELGHGEETWWRETASADRHTFGEIAALELKAEIYCSDAMRLGPIDRRRASPRPLFRDDPIPLHQDPVHWQHMRLPRVGRDRAIRAAASLAGRTHCIPVLQDLSPSWAINHIPIDQPPWNVVDWRAGDTTSLSGLSPPALLAYPWTDVETNRFHCATGARNRWTRKT